MGYLKRMMAVVPDSLLLVRIQLDLAPVNLAPANHSAGHTAGYTAGHTAGNVAMQAISNASHMIADWTASPTEAWAARLGLATAAAMTQIDAAFPGRVVGAQILHGVTCKDLDACPGRLNPPSLNCLFRA